MRVQSSLWRNLWEIWKWFINFIWFIDISHRPARIRGIVSHVGVDSSMLWHNPVPLWLRVKNVENPGFFSERIPWRWSICHREGSAKKICYCMSHWIFIIKINLWLMLQDNGPLDLANVFEDSFNWLTWLTIWIENHFTILWSSTLMTTN